MPRYAEVAVFPHRVPLTKRVPAAYTYLVPEDWPPVQPGLFVLAPFGTQSDFDRLVSGIVVRVTGEKPDIPRLKSLEALLHVTPVISPAHLELAQWLAETTVEPLSNCVRLFAPPGQAVHSDIEYTLIERDDPLPRFSKVQAELIELLHARGPLRAGQINTVFGQRDWKRPIARLIDQGWVQPRQVLPAPGTRGKRIKLVERSAIPIDPGAIPLGRSAETKQRRQVLLAFLQQRRAALEVDWLLAETGSTPADLDFLAAKGLIEFRYREVLRDPLADRIFAPAEPPVLTEDQAHAWNEILPALDPSPSLQPSSFLLFGITGSGKTEIYLRAVAEVLRQGRQVIVLVPEIALTPQTIRRFAARFPDRMAVWHSELSVNERYDTWRRVQLGEVDLVIGARSALFLPFAKLGLIVIDEEHDGSYKQSDSGGLHDMPVRFPLYHARETAVELARLTHATVILGSATPSLEAWDRARRGEYRLLTLSRRVLGHTQVIHAQEEQFHVQAKSYRPAEVESARYTDLPPVAIVDMRAELKSGNVHLFSRRLQQALAAVLQRGEQAILFMNRRGQATFVMCRDCGYVVLCPRCDSPLTYHEPLDTGQAQGIAPPALICHACNYREVQPQRCAVCGSTRIRYFGSGTQKIESELVTMFPRARTLRWDRDTTTGKGAHEMILQRFSEHQADVLVGTQMIAKGLDLPLVTLVGVVSADTSLHMPDFRASERTFQLLTQVAGRAGRGLLGGRAIIQTYAPDHYAIETASQHDYAAFVKHELAFRQAANYPPFTRLARLLVRDLNADRAKAEAEQVANELDALLTRRGVARGSIIGPAPCFFARLRDEYRWQIVIRHVDPVSIVKELKLGMNWRIDIDPLNLL
ncbi:MAG TPA: primosomal protein N' [Anaerolineae bacterium]|nr:primosomal protein N' [Anaerolineae bacterium]